MATSLLKRAPCSLRKKPAETELMASGRGISSQVRVFVRVRPLTAKEQGAGSTGVLDISNACVVQLSGRRFTYDAAFDAETTQAELYEKLAPTLLHSFLDGFNATVSFGY
jgi:kinesin family member 11